MSGRRRQSWEDRLFSDDDDDAADTDVGVGGDGRSISHSSALTSTRSNIGFGRETEEEEDMRKEYANCLADYAARQTSHLKRQHNDLLARVSKTCGVDIGTLLARLGADSDGGSGMIVPLPFPPKIMQLACNHASASVSAPSSTVKEIGGNGHDAVAAAAVGAGAGAIKNARGVPKDQHHIRSPTVILQENSAKFKAIGKLKQKTNHRYSMMLGKRMGQIKR